MTAIVPTQKASTNKYDWYKLSYNGFNFLSGFLELGCIIFFIVAHENIILVLLAGLSYQLGNLAASTIGLSKKTTIVIVFLSVTSLIVYQRTGITVFYFVAIAFASIALQKMRRLIVLIIGSERVSTFSKRTVRIAGFLIAGFASGTTILIACLGILVITCFIATQHAKVWADSLAVHKVKMNTLSSIMIIHQSHYFSYAYWIPILFIYKLGIPYYLIGPFFILGWLSYIFSEKLFGGFNEIKVFILGHLTVAISLIILGMFNNILHIVMIAWFISGLGGGTVFCLKRLNKTSSKPTDLEIWEDVGHVSGVLISIAFAFLFADRFGNPFFVSAAIAMITALTIFLKKGELAK